MAYSTLKAGNCSYCGSDRHTSLACFDKPRKALRFKAPKTEEKDTQFKLDWFKANPPDEHGEWECYLQISGRCLKVVTYDTIQREHVKSKARHKELQYVLSNVRPACRFCNKLKGSLDLEDLVEDHPHLQKYL